MANLVSEIPVPLNTLALWSRGFLSEYIRQDTITAADIGAIWRSLIKSLTTPTLSEKQITSTCNCLRIFLKSSASAQNVHVKTLPLIRDEWMKCYAAVCDVWPRAKAKPLLQLLEVLLQIAKNGMTGDEVTSIWRIISLELSKIILSSRPTRDLTRALYLTSFFLEKNLSYDIYQESVQRNREEGTRRAGGTNTWHMDRPNALIYAVLLSFEQHDAQSSAEKCFRTLVKAGSQHAPESRPWWLLVKGFVADHVNSLDAIANSVFPALLEQEPFSYLDVIHSQDSVEDRNSLVFLLTLLQSLREREIIDQHDLFEYLQHPMSGQASAITDATSLLLSHADDGVRVRALRLLATSKMTNEPVSLRILRHLEASIPLWFRPGGSHERGELLSILRKLLVRLRGGSSTLGKSAPVSRADREMLDAHEKFVKTLVTSVLDELRPNASYQRRIMGLSIFKYLLESKVDRCDRIAAGETLMSPSIERVPVCKVRKEPNGSNDPDWPYSVCLRTMSTVQDLLNLTSDAYDDVRALSASILRHLLLTQANNSHARAFLEQLQTALALLIPSLASQAARTNRSDHADGLGRVYGLLDLVHEQSRRSDTFIDGHEYSISVGLVSRLERVLKDKASLHKPYPEPLHSLLNGIMYCIIDANPVEIHKRVIDICGLVWKAVADRLCVDSPEMTEEDADDFEEAVTGPKDMLSYSWRALSCSSLLLRALLNSPRRLGTGQMLEDLSIIGALCMEQLTMLRHRGAFSTVAQTFTICCQRTMDIQGLELLGLRLRWYQEAETQVDQQADRLTRRSAGLPAMMASILSPEDDRSFQLFIDSFIARSQITEDVESSQTNRHALPQVHAMNTLREVIINSRFRNAIGPHLQKLLALATENLGSNIWAIQNCGLMLYRACILRLPAEDDCGSLTHKTLKFSDGCSTSLELALELLRSGPKPAKTLSNASTKADLPIRDIRVESPSVGVEKKFAALDLLSPMKKVKHAIRIDLFELLSSPLWLVRERAAVVLALLTPFEEFYQQIGYCFDNIALETPQNRLHGILLYGRQILGRWLSGHSNLLPSSTLEHLAQRLLLVMGQITKRYLAPPVWAVMFEIANDIMERSLRTQGMIRFSLFSQEFFCSSYIPNSYLSDRALLYNVALDLIVSENLGLEEKDQVFSAFLNRMKIDSDVARNVLERLLERGLVFQPEELLLLYENLPPQTHVDVVSFIVDMVSLSIERSPSHWNILKCQQALDLLNHSSRTREFSGLSIIARARVLSVLTLHCNESDVAVSRQKKRFERDVWHAASDEMDKYIRLQTARAISAYLPSQRRTGLEGSALLFKLRDLLNDEDEEVRTSAARATSSFLDRDGDILQSEIMAQGICAPAASARLEDYFRSMVCDHPFKQEVLLRRLFNVGHHTSLQSFLHENAMEDQLKIIKDEARALFAVERQNLYIDEVHESYFWSSMCKANTSKQHEPLPESLESTLGAWLVDGLSIMQTLLGDMGETAMLPDLTFDLDILLLCLRVVSAAGAYLSTQRSEVQRHKTDLISQTIRQHLRDLKLLDSQRHFNPELTRSLNQVVV